jgi:hypothetical protein
MTSYSNYSPEIKDIIKNPIHGRIPSNVLQSINRLSLPTKDTVKATLERINHALRIISDDHRYQNRSIKTKRVLELQACKRKVLFLLSQYDNNPSTTTLSSSIGMRARNIKETRVKTVPIENGRTIHSRKLEYEFDENTNTLATPHYQNICSSIEFYNKLASKVCHQYNSTLPFNKHEREKLMKAFTGFCNKSFHLDNLRVAMKEKNLKADLKFDEIVKVPCKEGCVPLGRLRRKTFVPFSNFIELPPRRKLARVLTFYENLHERIKTIERIENGLREKSMSKTLTEDNQENGLF